MKHTQIKNIDIHFHRFKIYVWILCFRRHIGYTYMKCGTDSRYGYDKYPEGLPKVTGIEIFKIGKFGVLPKNETEITFNKDGQYESL